MHEQHTISVRDPAYEGCDWNHMTHAHISMTELAMHAARHRADCHA